MGPYPFLARHKTVEGLLADIVASVPHGFEHPDNLDEALVHFGIRVNVAFEFALIIPIRFETGDVHHAALAQSGQCREEERADRQTDIALLQEKLGDSCGVCCQKVSEAEVFTRGGIKDVLVSNQVRDAAKIDRLARIPKLGAG